MLRISDKESSLDFFINALGLKEVRTIDVEEGRFSLIFPCSRGK
jgi:lactoylglutathione lyase